MKARLISIWDTLHSSYWFVPSIMAALSIVLSFSMISLDGAMSEEEIGRIGWFYSGGPDGAREVLSSIVGSMITVTGVVFSITIVALTLASQQFGPRVLRNFMRDTGNQLVLGTFIATFIYSMLVLRTIRGTDATTFVPHISITVGVFLAMISIGVLIYFIHHMSSFIQASTILAAVHGDFEETITRIFPEKLGVGSEENELTRGEKDIPEGFDAEAAPVRYARRKSGYLQQIDNDMLMRLTTHHSLVVHLSVRPGDFIHEGTTLMRAWPPQMVDRSLPHKISEVFIVGAHRTSVQDVEFVANQFVEVAVRSLSPSINDPFTARVCIDYLGAGLCRLAERRIPSPYRYDENKKLRVIAEPITFEAMVHRSFDQIRQYGRTSATVIIRLLGTIRSIAGFVSEDAQRAALLAEADMILRGGREEIPEERDRQEIERQYLEAVAALGKAVQGGIRSHPA